MQSQQFYTTNITPCWHVCTADLALTDCQRCLGSVGRLWSSIQQLTSFMCDKPTTSTRVRKFSRPTNPTITVQLVLLIYVELRSQFCYCSATLLLLAINLNEYCCTGILVLVLQCQYYSASIVLQHQYCIASIAAIVLQCQYCSTSILVLVLQRQYCIASIVLLVLQC